MSDNIEDIRHHIIKRLTECVSELEAQISELLKYECPSCKEGKGRVLKWMDHANCTPTKAQRYKKLLEFVKQLADESVYERYENLNEMNWSAFDLLKEIGEN